MKNIFNFFKYLFVLFACSLITDIVFASNNFMTEQLQATVDQYLAQHKQDEYISAITLTVDGPQLKNPTTIFSGYTDMTHSMPVTVSNLYEIGSVTKSFTSVILLQLEAEGKLNINDPIGKYLPEYPKWQGVSIKQLLNMTSGIPTYTNNVDLLTTIANNPTQQFTASDLINYVKDKDFVFPPGAGFDYSNTNYALASMIIEAVTGKTVRENIYERFIQPGNLSNLFLQNTYYLEDDGPLYPEPKNIYDRMVHGYMDQEGFSSIFPLQLDMTPYALSWAGPAGAIISTPQDVIQWVKALYTSTTLLPDKQRQELKSLISTDTGQPMDAPTKDNAYGYGLGIQAKYTPTETIYFYEGQTFSHRMLYDFFPKENIIIAIGINSAVEDQQDHIGTLMNQVYKIVTDSIKIS